MTFTDQINEQIQHQVALAFDVGMTVPEILFLGSLDPERREQIIYDPTWEITSRDIGMAMKKMDGIPIMASAWWSGDHFDFHTLAIQDRALLNGGQGPTLNSNIMTIWSWRLELLKKIFKKLSQKIMDKEPDYVGFINIELTLGDDLAYFRRIFFGATYDFLYCLSALHEKDLNILFDSRSENTRGFSSSVRLHAYPYGLPENKNLVDSIRDRMALPELKEGDETYICVRQGDTIRESWDRIMSDLGPLGKHGICYRLDGSHYTRKIFNEIKRRQYA